MKIFVIFTLPADRYLIHNLRRTGTWLTTKYSKYCWQATGGFQSTPMRRLWRQCKDFWCQPRSKWIIKMVQAGTKGVIQVQAFTVDMHLVLQQVGVRVQFGIVKLECRWIMGPIPCKFCSFIFAKIMCIVPFFSFEFAHLYVVWMWNFIHFLQNIMWWLCIK